MCVCVYVCVHARVCECVNVNVSDFSYSNALKCIAQSE